MVCCIGCGKGMAGRQQLRVDPAAGVCGECGDHVAAWDAGIRVRRYRPEDGAAAMDFIGRWCGSCRRDDWLRVPDIVGGCEEGRCEVLDRTMRLDVSDAGYPVEWMFGSHGYPVCTAYVPHDDQSLREAA